MGPLTMKTAPTPAGRGHVVQKRLVLPAIAHGDFDWYLAFVIERLTAYGTAQQPPNIAVRVFAWGLQYASTPEQWNQWKKTPYFHFLMKWVMVLLPRRVLVRNTSKILRMPNWSNKLKRLMRWYGRL